MVQPAGGEEKVLPPLPRRRILIVDDNQDAASSLAILLKMVGHETRVAHDGPSALGIVDEYKPEVILLDIGMPKMSGYEVCRRIREQADGDGMLIVAVTGWGQEEDRRKSEEAQFDGHMVKPVDPQALMKLLAELHAVKT